MPSDAPSLPAGMAIRISGVGKRYRRTRKPSLSLRDDLAGLLTLRALRRPDGETEDFVALAGIDLEVRAGERLGVLGRNGAGKSTLLKILCRITPPSEGMVVMRGSTACLLEVGTGFHPELSGLENIFLNGAILGLPRAGIAARLDEIVAFAEIGDFLYTPVKHYSSGMYVRLAFSIAAHLDPDILIVDEVLAVGDLRFREKCLRRMRSVGDSGRTVVFVSHDAEAVREVCTRAVIIERGALAFDGAVGEAIARYRAEALGG